jgi:transcription initiation factor TFIID subunit 10
MDFESNDEGDAGMIPVMEMPAAYSEDSASIYPMGAKASIPKATATTAAAAPLEDQNEKDILELLGMMDDFEPLIPEALTDYYMSKCGVECDDVRLKKLVALVAQKFISDVAMDAMAYSRMRQTSSASGMSEAARKAAALKNKQTLTMEDLAAALTEHGISIRKPPYHL